MRHWELKSTQYAAVQTGRRTWQIATTDQAVDGIPLYTLQQTKYRTLDEVLDAIQRKHKPLQVSA